MRLLERRNLVLQLAHAVPAAVCLEPQRLALRLGLIPLLLRRLLLALERPLAAAALFERLLVALEHRLEVLVALLARAELPPAPLLGKQLPQRHLGLLDLVLLGRLLLTRALPTGEQRRELALFGFDLTLDALERCLRARAPLGAGARRVFGVGDGTLEARDCAGEVALL